MKYRLTLLLYDDGILWGKQLLVVGLSVTIAQTVTYSLIMNVTLRILSCTLG